MATTYRDKTVIVTGASQGIGKALCLAVAPERPRLVLAARDERALQGVAEACRALGAEALVRPTDVGLRGDSERLVAAALERFGTIDALVNNAGLSMWARVDEIKDVGLYEELIRVNYLSSVYLTRAALGPLVQSRGQIVAVTSVAGFTGVPTRSGYAASKHAMVGFFDSLRIELQGTGCSVTVVAPDFVASEIRRRSLGPEGRPLGSSPMDEARLMSAERCAAEILRAMRARRRQVVLSWRGRVGLFARLLVPGLIDRIAARAVSRGR